MELSNKIKKIIGIVCISTLSVAAVIGLCLLFKFFGNFTGLTQILFTLLSVFVGCLLLLNSIEGIKRKSKIALTSAALILLSTLLSIIDIWIVLFKADIIHSIFTKGIVVIAALSILFNLIVSKSLVLGKKIFVIQLLTYIGVAFLEIKIVSLILGFNFVNNSVAVTAVSIITGVMFIILIVKGKTSMKDDSKYITITLEEYNEMKAKIAEYENQK